MIIRSYITNSGQLSYETVSRDEAIEKVGRYYNQPEELIAQLENGELPCIKTTPWAIYRMEMDASAA